MMFTKTTFGAWIVLCIVSVPALAAGGPDASSGFLADYALLKPAKPGQVGQYVYVAPNALARGSSYAMVFIDQPYVAVAPDSKYKALKPDDAKTIADAMRESLANAIAGGYAVTDRAGPTTLALRVSLSNIHLEKKGRRVLAYTPVGFVLSEAKNVLITDIMDHVNLDNVAIEAEITDSVNGDLFAESYDQLGTPSKKASWDDLEKRLAVYAKRIRCNLDNARLAPGQQADCTAIAEPH